MYKLKGKKVPDIRVQSYLSPCVYGRAHLPQHESELDAIQCDLEPPSGWCGYSSQPSLKYWDISIQLKLRGLITGKIWSCPVLKIIT